MAGRSLRCGGDVDASCIPRRGATVDTPIRRAMRERRQDTNMNLKRQVACNNYTVDPQRVASALIVRLVQESVLPQSPATGGPNPAGDAAGRLRQAA